MRARSRSSIAASRSTSPVTRARTWRACVWLSVPETSMSPQSTILRHRTRVAQVGGVAIGGGAPIVVQSMTNTDTADVAATVAQVKALADAGSELVRVTVNTREAAAAVP